jgi:NAD(P)H-nitrite reductase large subunit
MPAKQYLLVGNGPAGWAAAEAIRERDPHGQITILSHEGTAFYSRPGLAYAHRRDPGEAAHCPKRSGHRRLNAAAGRPVVAIDPASAAFRL